MGTTAILTWKTSSLRNRAFRVFEPPPLQPHTPTRERSTYDPVRPQLPHTGCLLLGRERPEAAKYGPTPVRSFRGGRALVIDRDHDIAEVSDGLMIKLITGPLAQYCLGVRLAVDVDEQRIPLVRVEVVRPYHPRIHHYARTDIQLNKLGVAGEKRKDSLPEIRIVLNPPHNLVLRKADQLDDRRLLKARTGMESPP